jgi:hypothetical protein
MALVGTLLVPATVLVAQGLEATLIDVKGEVEWSPAGATQWQRVGAATVVHTGDRLRTAENSAARLAYFEGSTTDLAASTGVRLDNLNQSADGTVIKLTQVSGTTQAQVQPSPANTNYQVESPAALASAPTTTCPWVRVGRDGTTMVRNYMNMPPLAVEPVAVQEIIYTTGWQFGPAGPRMGQQAILNTAIRAIPVPAGFDEPALVNCPFGPPTAGLAPDGLALDATTTTGSETAASLAGTIAIAGATLEIGAGVPSGAAGRVLEQGGPPVITVQNTSGGQIAAVTLLPGYETQVVVGQPPSTPAPIGTHAAMAIAQGISTRAQNQATGSNLAYQSILQNSAAYGQLATVQAIADSFNRAFTPQMPSSPPLPSTPSQSSSSSSSSQSSSSQSSSSQSPH